MKRLFRFSVLAFFGVDLPAVEPPPDTKYVRYPALVCRTPPYLLQMISFGFWPLQGRGSQERIR